MMRSLRNILVCALAVASCEAHKTIRKQSDQQQDEARELIVGGQRVSGNDFNFFARMENDRNHLCGGALVSPTHVVTSAYCLKWVFHRTNGRPSAVRVGFLNDLSADTVFGVKCVIVHPEFDDSGTYPVADIAVVVLDRSSRQEPVRMNDRDAYPTGGSVLTLAGYGSTNANSSTPSPSLQQVELNYVDFGACQTVYYGNNLTEGLHFCAGGDIVTGKGGCISDGGGPAVGVNAWYSSDLLLAGIYSFDASNCGNGIPDVFTPISAYFLWINLIISQGCAATPQPTSTPSVSLMPSVSHAPSPAPTPAPTTPNPTPAPTAEPAACICFSEDATVDVLGQGQVAMKDLQVGQQVFAGYQDAGMFDSNKARTPLYETVYGFGHRNEEAFSDYLRITTNASGNKRPIEISGAHLIFVHGKKDPVRADSLQVGEKLLHKPLHHDATTPARITKIELVSRRGLYQPLTKDGTILVDGVQASTYVSVDDLAPRVVGLGLTIFSEQIGFHWWMAPYRFVCTKVSPQLCINDYNNDEGGITHWLALGKRIVQVGEKLPTWLLAIYVTVILACCGSILFVDSLLEGSNWALSTVGCGFGLYWLWSLRRRAAGKAKVE